MGNSFKKGAGGARASKTGRKSAATTFKSKYRLGKELGSGAFSVVVLGTASSPVEGTDSREFAIKVIKKASLTDEDKKGLQQEIAIMKGIRHRHVIRLYEHYEDAKDHYLVTELVEGGELFERIVKKNRYSELEARECVKVILETMAFLHEHGVVHRDLKPENLLLTSKHDDADIKVADFGFAKHVDEGGDVTHAFDTQCGTPGYVAPEILTISKTGVSYGTPVDVWSIGVIVYIMLGGYPPFYNDNQAKLFDDIKKARYQFHPKYWDHISVEAKDLIRHMLVLDPNARPSCRELLNFDWLTQGDEHLSTRDISQSLEELRSWNVKRKFKGAVNTVIAAQRLTGGFTTGGGASAAAPADPAAAEEAPAPAEAQE